MLRHRATCDASMHMISGTDSWIALQPSDTADIVTALEEGQLILGGLASNR